MSDEAWTKMKAFLKLARVLRSARDRNFLPCEDPADALDEADDLVTALKSNFEDYETSEAKLENAAGLLAAVLALADLLMEGIPLEEIETLIATN